MEFEIVAVIRGRVLIDNASVHACVRISDMHTRTQVAVTRIPRVHAAPARILRTTRAACVRVNS